MTVFTTFFVVNNMLLSTRYDSSEESQAVKPSLRSLFLSVALTSLPLWCPGNMYKQRWTLVFLKFSNNIFKAQRVTGLNLF
jgi:hypothetical protein